MSNGRRSSVHTKPRKPSEPRRTKTLCEVLWNIVRQCVAAFYDGLRHTKRIMTSYDLLQRRAKYVQALQCATTRYETLRHIAMYYDSAPLPCERSIPWRIALYYDAPRNCNCCDIVLWPCIFAKKSATALCALVLGRISNVIACCVRVLTMSWAPLVVLNSCISQAQFLSICTHVCLCWRVCTQICRKRFCTH